MADYYTALEETDIEELKMLGFDVCNPSDEEYKEGWAEKSMGYANELIASCNGLVFRRLPNGGIPAGVAYEIDVAAENGLPILELPYISGPEIMTREETRKYIQDTLGAESWYNDRIKKLYGEES